MSIFVTVVMALDYWSFIITMHFLLTTVLYSFLCYFITQLWPAVETTKSHMRVVMLRTKKRVSALITLFVLFFWYIFYALVIIFDTRVYFWANREFDTIKRDSFWTKTVTFWTKRRVPFGHLFRQFLFFLRTIKYNEKIEPFSSSPSNSARWRVRGQTDRGYNGAACFRNSFGYPLDIDTNRGRQLKWSRAQRQCYEMTYA